MRYILMEVTVKHAGTVPLTTQASDLHAPQHLHGLCTCTASLLSAFSWRSRPANPHSPPGKPRGPSFPATQIAPPARHLEGRKIIAVQLKGDTPGRGSRSRLMVCCTLLE